MSFQRVKSYCKNVGIGIDQLANTLCGGWPDETISAVCWRKSNLKGHYLFKLLKYTLDFVFTPLAHDHCFKSYISEKERAQLPKEYRNADQTQS